MSWPAPALGAAAIVLSIVAASPALATGPVTTPIASVQGTGSTTPLDGQVVTVDGVVTAVLPTFGGIYIQSQKSAGIDGASDGIFIAISDSTFSLGDLISVTGVAGEAHGQTEIDARTAALVTADVALPDAVSLASDTTGAHREPCEGELVEPVGDYYLSSTDNTTGSLVLSAGAPEVDAATKITLDDGFNVSVAAQPFLLADTVIRPGDTLVAAEKPMVLGQGDDGYRFEPSSPITANSAADVRPKFTADSPRLGGAPRLNP